jgi:RHS repeat-associated protein
MHSHLIFTGKERDTESNLDYFGARYYASNMGRWMSPDWSSNPSPIPFGNIYHPHSLNLYSYVGNRPTTGIDPYGHLDCSGGALQDVACAVTAATKKIWNWLSSGGNGGSSQQTSVTFTQQDNLSGPSNFNRNYALNYSGFGVSGGRGYGFGNGTAASAGADFIIYNDGTGNRFFKSVRSGYTAGYEAHASFGRLSGDPYNPGTSSSSVNSLNLGVVYASWFHSEGWSDYQFSFGVGARGFGFTSMHQETSTEGAHSLDP